MSNTIYDRATMNWFKKYPGRQTTVCKCEKCGLFYKPTLGHKCKKEGESDDIKINCPNCAEEHEQLAEWLEELNGLRELKDTITGNSESLVRKGYNNAVDDFENKIKECIYEKGLYFDRYLVEEIAEKLRGCDGE